MSQHKALIEKLYDKSQKGGIEWTETASETTFAVHFSNYSVSITETEGAEPEVNDYVFAINGSNGRLIETFTDISVARDLSTEEKQAIYGKARELFEMARRKARGADKAVREILQALDLDDEIPF